MKDKSSFSFREWIFRALSRVSGWFPFWRSWAPACFSIRAEPSILFVRKALSSYGFFLRIYFYLGLLLVSFLMAVLLDALLNRKAWLHRFWARRCARFTDAGFCCIHAPSHSILFFISYLPVLHVGFL